MTDGQALYRHICSTTDVHIPLTAQPWWLDSVSAPVGKSWDAVVVRHRGEPVAAMPYQLTRKGPFAFFLMPQLTQVGALWVSPDADRTEAVRQMVECMRHTMADKRCLVTQCSAYMRSSDAVFFAQSGFEVRENVSYCIEPSADNFAIERAFHEDKRRMVRKGRSLFSVVERNDIPAEFYSFLTHNLAQRGSTPFYGEMLWRTLFDAADARGQVSLLWAMASDGKPAAALMMVRDDQREYYLVPTYDAGYARSGAMEMLTAHAIRRASDAGRVFDFEGSMQPGIATAYRRYGSEPQTYYVAVRYANSFVRTLLKRKIK